ncbi:hypothetical protein EV127DRAFT_482929 [Xylaria flabelliformis]|nr:hypothetical protein EV127DRAFT_482929 [Xylaria flabelliformis]
MGGQALLARTFFLSILATQVVVTYEEDTVLSYSDRAAHESHSDSSTADFIRRLYALPVIRTCVAPSPYPKLLLFLPILSPPLLQGPSAV